MIAGHAGEARVYEVDTTDLEPAEVAAEIRAVVAGMREPSAGTVSFVDYLDDADVDGPLEPGSVDDR